MKRSQRLLLLDGSTPPPGKPHLWPDLKNSEFPREWGDQIPGSVV